MKTENNWVRIHRTNTLASAEMIKGMLEENDIEVHLINKIDSAYVVIGYTEIYVREHRKEEALQLIQNTDENE